MQKDRSESVVSPGMLATLTQVAINPNLAPMVEKVGSLLCTILQEPTVFEISIGAEQQLVHEFAICGSSKPTTQRRKNVASLSQILSIPRFETKNTRKRSTTLYCHNKLLTSAVFAPEVKEKLKSDATKKKVIQERNKRKQEETRRKNQEKGNKKIDSMVEK